MYGMELNFVKCNNEVKMYITQTQSSSLPGEVQAFHEDLNGRLHINEVFKFSVDKLYDILFTQSQFMSDFNEQRRISGELTSDLY